MKAKQILIRMFVLSLVILLAACAGKIQGIDSPLEVDGVQIQLTSAKLQDSMELGTDTYQANSAGDTILSVTASTSENNPPITVSVTDENGRVDVPSITQSETGGGASTLTWMFGVSKSGGSFTLNLPGEVDIPLDSLLGE